MVDEQIVIRRAGPPDASALSEFAARSFSDAFGAQNRPEDIAAHLAATFTEQRQAEELSDRETITIIADHAGVIAGYAQVRRASGPACVTGDAPVELWRFYVDRHWHGKGLAGKLMHAVVRAARELGGATLWLSVWERNPRAISFYRKHGFSRAGAAVFRVGSDPQTDQIMVADVDGISGLDSRSNPMTRLEEHQQAYRYNKWANERTLEAAAALTDEEFGRDLGSSFPSIRRTLIHILAAEWIWLRRWKGESPGDMPEGWDALDIDGIRTAWHDVESERADWLTTLSTDDLDRITEYRNTRAEPHARPLWQLLRHVVNHSSYHRGQVTTLLRQLEARAVSTDFVYFFAEP